MSYPGFDITGKVCLVTGGTSGIGRAIVLALVQAGAKVVAGSSSEAKVAGMRKELGDGHDVIQIDVASEASVKSAVEHTIKRFGRIDASINAAGVIKRQPSLEMPIAEFKRIVDINLTGTFIVAQAVGRVMKDQSLNNHGERGSIVNIASLNSFISLSEVLAYAASKSGVMGLTRGLANEWAQYGIRVNGIAPGVFPTDLNRPLIEGTPRGEWLKKHTPMARFGQAEELAGAAIYLISPAGSYTTGETIIVDGGFLRGGCELKYEVIIYWSEPDAAFIAEVPELPGCTADGVTKAKALTAVEQVAKEWIETAKGLGRDIPKARGRLMFV